MQRLKVPPAVNQFSKTLNKNQATELFKLLNNYKPETADEKKARLKAQAEAKAGGAAGNGDKPGPVIKFGLKHGASSRPAGRSPAPPTAPPERALTAVRSPAHPPLSLPRQQLPPSSSRRRRSSLSSRTT